MDRIFRIFFVTVNNNNLLICNNTKKIGTILLKRTDLTIFFVPFRKFFFPE